MIGSRKLATAAVLAAPLIAMGATSASAQTAGQTGDPGSGAHTRLEVSAILSGRSLDHTFTTSSGSKASATLTKPDDLTALGGVLFVAFQNGVGSQGEPSSTGNPDSTIVAFTHQGRELGQWDVAGKVDGMTADRAHHQLVATVNEDGNSSLYTVGVPDGGIRHYRYSQNPLPHGGGTDAPTVYHGHLLISASAPTDPSGPAVYSVSLDPATLVATATPVFYDNSTATSANGSSEGKTVQLALTDPDSNAVVPDQSPRFADQFQLDSQGDQQQVYVADPGSPHQQLSVLNLDQSVNDTAWATSPDGTLYASDSSADQIDAITRPFTPGTAFVAVTPCGANSAPADCSAPNYLGTLDMWTGHVTAAATSGSFQPGGLVFVASHRGDGHHHGGDRDHHGGNGHDRGGDRS